MTELADIFERLGLLQYLDGFIEEGFDSWEIVLYATESDLEALGVRLGHRRKLQKEIAEARGISIEQVIGAISRNLSTDELPHGDSDTRSVTSQGEHKATTPTTAGPAKRKYRRHPKPDENAPERAPSAYVIFSNKTREELKPLKLTFTNIAKTVGERWQVLDPEEKEQYEAQAAAAKERFNTALAKYKRTSQYRDYQKYLVDFKARNVAPSIAGAKRPKLETEISGASSSGGSVSLSADPSVDPRRKDSEASQAYSPPVISESVTTSPVAVSRAAPIHATVASRDSSVQSSMPSTPVNIGFPSAGHFTGHVSRPYMDPQQPGLPRLPPFERRDTRPTISSIVTDLSHMPNPRRTGPTVPAALSRHETSNTSSSSNLSRDSTVSTAYTPITPIDESRSMRSLPRIPGLMRHGSSSDSALSGDFERRSLPGPPTRMGLDLGDSTPKPNLGYQQSFNQLSLETEHRNLQHPRAQHPEPSQRQSLPPVSFGSSHGETPTTDRMDSLSVLALAGRIVDRDFPDPIDPTKRL